MILKIKHKDVFRTVIIDDEDFDLIKDCKVHIHPGKQTHYARCFFAGGKRKYLHRLVKPTPDGMFIDHINSNGLDNRKSNLRICSIKENSRKQSKQSRETKFKYKGVTHREGLSKPFRSHIYVDGKWIDLGYYKTLEEAALVYNEAAVKYFGEFVILNEVK